jgi:beta-mannosidase
MSTTLNLHGDWQLTCKESDMVWQTRLPGDVHSTLLDQKHLTDPYYGTQENAAQWVHERHWTFSRRFEVDAAMLEHDHVYLNAEMVDTLATIKINGKKIVDTDNQFRRYHVDVAKALIAGSNTIELIFTPPIGEAKKRAASYPLDMPYTTNNRVPHMNHLRKTACHGGWDWGVCLVLIGVYGDLSLNAVNDARIEHVYTTQHHRKNAVDVDITIELLGITENKVDLEIELAGQQIARNIAVKPGEQTLTERITINKPRLWWPAGHGDQPLYDLSVRVGDQAVSKRIGLRHIHWDNSRDNIGTQMTLYVNGKPIFCKGANWIPTDGLATRQTDEVFERLIDDTVAANMNMLRVWGGGQYERDRFYELCDEKGVMIWHDLMFACQLYPFDDAFIDNVAHEINFQVKRLRDHASMVLWCGDNEVEGAMGWFEQSRKNHDTYLVAYDRLNHANGKAVAKADPDVTYWPSSPSNGPGQFGNVWDDDASGDMHYWAVWHQGKSFSSYYDVIPRFCSEFGYQSFSSIDLVKKYIDPSHFNPTSPQMEHHQRNPRGNSLIMEMFTRYFRMPTSFENTLYLSQVQQAVAIKTAVEYWRSLRPVCMGTLIWQLNDNWPVASWSSIEYDGSWKQLHYHAKRFYESVMVTMFHKSDDVVQVVGINDHFKSAKLSLKLQLVDFAGKVQKVWTRELSLAASSSKPILKLPIDKLPIPRNEGVLVADITVTQPDGKKTQLRNTHFMDLYKRCELADANVTANIKQQGKAFVVELKTDKPAFFVTCAFTHVAGVFDDNSVDLLPGKATKLKFTPRENVSLTQLKKALHVTHLRMTY